MGTAETTEGNLSEERFSSNSFPKTFASFWQGAAWFTRIDVSGHLSFLKRYLPPAKKKRKFQREIRGQLF
ncbi:hypothetical protein, partial [uncultured Ruminococcus sp.]|uniref:hypothetical protein n=1 Tax=uncultured Ruminococcus sp. TaxID=165186 RepID=UPI0025DCBFF5